MDLKHYSAIAINKRRKKIIIISPKCNWYPSDWFDFMKKSRNHQPRKDSSPQGQQLTCRLLVGTWTDWLTPRSFPAVVYRCRSRSIHLHSRNIKIALEMVEIKDWIQPARVIYWPVIHFFFEGDKSADLDSSSCRSLEAKRWDCDGIQLSHGSSRVLSWEIRYVIVGSNT